MEFKIGKEYSSKTIENHCKNIKTFGKLEGGKHTIESDNLKFVMLSEGAWRGGKSYYYKCVRV